ncbi:MATE family efflux transporter [Dyadobacter frigoris]|uniref:Multidrug-efflux transporter n=1 Tax=Dyadobacter frigoris TaxID=2576211 RepID=A0A4U6D7U0_9BACT|nr:MATE family efflux transporter [Dyadobacter frigoris]TKT93530.1 MATE family efflux transporter [Dyadobacter frigoris]GLU55737.1 MATE family efflux transporter [Dyadobacter frigoris]
MKKWFQLLRQALSGSEESFTDGSINRAIFLLSVPMIMEMVMESLFAVVDIFFVSKVSIEAVATVGLTESVITLVYSVAIGLSTAATATIARRIGEGNMAQARVAIGQVILISLGISLPIAVAGFIFAGDVLSIMGADPKVIETGTIFAQIQFLSAPVVILLYSLSGALRGAGAAATAMRSLIIANGLNMILGPTLIFGFGIIPAFGVAGAAIATALGRSIGVGYQLYSLTRVNKALAFAWADLKPHKETIVSMVKVAAGGTGQFLVSSASWIFLTRILAEFGSDVVAGYTIAIRVIMFTLLPAWGLANAAATLVGQNLGAEKPERAEISVWKCASYNLFFLVGLSVFMFAGAETIIGWFSPNVEVIHTGKLALRVLCLGYGFYAYGMVIIQSLNGAGDTKTPTILNLICFWLIEIPLAYLLSIFFALGPIGVFISVPVAESILALLGIWRFRMGKWKTVKI